MTTPTTTPRRRPTERSTRYDRPLCAGRLYVRLKPEAIIHLLLLSVDEPHGREKLIERVIRKRWQLRLGLGPLRVARHQRGERWHLPCLKLQVRGLYIDHLTALGDGEPAARERVLEALLANAYACATQKRRAPRKAKGVGSPP